MRPRRRTLWFVGLVIGVLMIVGGAAIGYLGYRRSSGPDGAVRAYFAALQAGDAPRALAWGDAPAGPHALLTSGVLRAQQRIAPIRDVHVGAVQRSGSRAEVAVDYTLAFDGADVPQHAELDLVDRDGRWRLTRPAVATQILLDNAVRRARLLGSAVPGGETLLFPGALPVTFDSSYLQIDPGQDYVGFDSGPVADVSAQVSDAGRAAVRAAVGLALERCLDGRVDVSCPVPDDRYVPGTVHGRLGVDALDDLTITLGAGDQGQILVGGEVSAVGSFERLTDANRAEPGHGTVRLAVHARVYAVAPLCIDWTAT